MDEARLVKISKYLAKHLRHQPERLDLALAPGGLVPVDLLLRACAAHSFPITRAELDEVVVRNNKSRFAFDPTGTLIRANQGHSVEIDLQLEADVATARRSARGTAAPSSSSSTPRRCAATAIPSTAPPMASGLPTTSRRSIYAARMRYRRP